MTEADESTLGAMPEFLKRKKEAMTEESPQASSVYPDSAAKTASMEQHAAPVDAQDGGVKPPTIEDALSVLKQIDAEVLATEQEEAAAMTKYAEAYRDLAARRLAAKKLLRTLARKV